MTGTGGKGSLFIEIVVASAIGLFVVLIGLGALAAARRCFHAAGSAAERQQPARQALDEMVRMLRDAGANLDSAGTSPPDEAVEGAWDACIVVRGDFDAAGLSGSAQDPEVPMSVPGPPVTTGPVTTGNDEIVGWFLRDGSSTGGTTLRFEADVASAVTVMSSGFGAVALRDGLVEAVDLARVETIQASPPYTLYRMTLAPAAASWAANSSVQVFPVADNVFSLRFRYLDATGSPLAAPGGAESAKSSRGVIAGIEVTLVLMSPDPDPAWVDTADPSPATRHFRKYPLRATVLPGYRGRTGAPDPADPPITLPAGLAG